MTVITRTAIPANVPKHRWTPVNVRRRLQLLSWTIKSSPLLAPRQVGCNGDIAIGRRCQTIASALIATQFVSANKRQTSLTMESDLTIISKSKQDYGEDFFRPVLQEGHCFSGKALLFSGHGTPRIDVGIAAKNRASASTWRRRLGNVGNRKSASMGWGESGRRSGCDLRLSSP